MEAKHALKRGERDRTRGRERERKGEKEMGEGGERERGSPCSPTKARKQKTRKDMRGKSAQAGQEAGA